MIGDMSSADGAPPSGAPTRRAVLRGTALAGAAAATALVGGCGIRLEDDALSIPLLQRKSTADEATLITTYHSLTSLSQMARRITPPTAVVTELADLHRTQADVVHGVLSRAGVPDHVIAFGAGAPAPSGAATPSVAVSAPPAATVALLAAAEAEAVSATAMAAVAGSTAAHRPLLTAIAAQHGFVVGPLGGDVTWPAGDPLPPPAAAGLLDASRSVAYAFEVVAAQLDPAARPSALATLTTVRARVAELTTMAGSAAVPDPLGYALPFAVTSPEFARKLATVVLTQLVARGLDPVPSIAAASSAVSTVARLQAQAQTLGHGWGVAMVPFPGLTYP